MPPSHLGFAEAVVMPAGVDGREADEMRQRRDPRANICNEMMRALPLDELEMVLAKAELVPLKPRQVLIEPNLFVRYGYFIETGLATLLASDGAQKPMEVGLVGRRGFVGIPLILGTRRSSLRCMVQLKGTAWRIPADEMEVLLEQCGTLRRILLAHIQGRLVQQALLNVCNASHTVPQRIGRWLLMARDRLQSDHVPATHDLIARMLGVRRPGVTAALGSLEEKGIIRLTRGIVEIRQPRSLQRCACGCFQRIDAEYERLLSVS